MATNPSSRQRTLPFAVAIASATIAVVIGLRGFVGK